MLCTTEYVFQFCNFRAPDPETKDAAIPVEDLPQYVWTALVFAITSSCISEAEITVYIVLEGHGNILQEKKALSPEDGV